MAVASITMLGLGGRGTRGINGLDLMSSGRIILMLKNGVSKEGSPSMW